MASALPCRRCWVQRRAPLPIAHIGIGHGGPLSLLRAALQPAPTHLHVDFSGTWVKDKQRSDSMEAAINLVALNAVTRQAVKLVRGVEIKQDADNFVFAVFSVISWFKVVERYKFDGSASSLRRRDLRRGGATGTVQAVHGGDQLLMELKWSDPHGGVNQDFFSLPSPNELHIRSVLTAEGRTVEYTSVFTRK